MVFPEQWFGTRWIAALGCFAIWSFERTSAAQSTDGTEVAAQAPANAPSVNALKEERRRGFYLRAAIGTTYAGIAGHGPSGNASVLGIGAEVGLYAGLTVTDRLVVGFGFDTAMASGTFNGGPTETLTGKHLVNGMIIERSSTFTTNAAVQRLTFGPMVDWYPGRNYGWHVGATLGLARLSVTDDAKNTLSGLQAGGFMFGGYDKWIGQKISLGAMLVIAGAPVVAMTNDDYRFAPVSVTVAGTVVSY